MVACDPELHMLNTFERPITTCATVLHKEYGNGKQKLIVDTAYIKDFVRDIGYFETMLLRPSGKSLRVNRTHDFKEAAEDFKQYCKDAEDLRSRKKS